MWLCDIHYRMKKDAFKSYWRETMELTANNKKMGTDLKQKDAEVVLSGKASMLVRFLFSISVVSKGIYIYLHINNSKILIPTLTIW